MAKLYFRYGAMNSGKSTSLLQAMAKGLPIVGSDVAGISDLLARAGGCGLLAADQSPEAFAAALRRARRPCHAQ